MKINKLQKEIEKILTEPKYVDDFVGIYPYDAKEQAQRIVDYLKKVGVLMKEGDKHE